jgi:hypothetical protein
MINWPGLQLKISDFIANQKSQSTLETATFFGTEYHNTVLTGTTMFGNNIVTPGDPNILINAFKSAFDMQLNSQIDLGIVPYTVIAGAIVTYWTSVKFNSLPPAPPTILPNPAFAIPPLQVCQLLVPGLPVPLNTLLMTAFKSGIAAPNPIAAGVLVSTAIILAFTTHITTISGIYNGLIPAVPSPIPSPPIPWVGVL